MWRDPLRPETVAEMGRLLTETNLSQREIAQRLALGASTVNRHLRLHGWRRPGETGAAEGPGLAAGRDDLPALIAECLALLRRQLSALPRRRSWNRSERMTEALRAIAETGRTLKELARVASTFGGFGAAAAPEGRETADDDLDDARFDALCDELADGFSRWRARRPPELPAGEPDAATGP